MIFFSPDFKLSYLFPVVYLVDIINLCNCFDVPRQSRVSEVGIAVDSVNNPGDTCVKKGCLWSQGTAGDLGSFDTCGEVGSAEELLPSKACCGRMREDGYSENGVRPQRVAWHLKGRLRVRDMVAWQPESLAATSRWWHGIPYLLISWTYKDTVCILSEETNFLRLSKCSQTEQTQPILIVQFYSWRATFL